jgi:signal transduction histidine kinase
VLTFLGADDGGRMLLLIIFVMLWLSSVSALEFGGLAQRATGWRRWRSIIWGTVLLSGGIMIGQTLAVLPASFGGNIPPLNRLNFFIGGSAIIVLGSGFAFYAISQRTLTVWCILKASGSLTAGQFAVSLLMLDQLVPLQVIRFDWGLLIAGITMGFATATGTFALTTTAVGPLNRLFAAAVLSCGIAGGRFLAIIGTSGLPLAEATTENDRISILSLDLHASPLAVMIGTVVVVAILVGLMALLLAARPWRANRGGVRTRHTQELRRRAHAAEDSLVSLAERLTDMTRQRDHALATSARALGSVQSIQATLNQEVDRRCQILDEHRQLLDRQAQQHSSFISAAVHETRHLVQQIVGDTARIIDPMRGRLSIEQGRLLTRIGDTTDQLLGLFCTLSDFGRLQAPTPSLPMRAVPIVDVMDRLRATLDPIAGHAGLRIDWPKDLALADLMLNTDPERLYQVLAELIRNGLRFNRPGGGVSVGVELLSAPSGFDNTTHLRFVIADSGVGIAADLAAVLFSPFPSRPSILPLGTSWGAGLGLAIAQRLAQSLNSRIVFASEPGIGSRFWLDIVAQEPIVTAPVQTAPAAPRPRDHSHYYALKAAQ